uniref:Uncharacterized protein n=1 Tax=Timema bartmani TaxID=61472 RepID=A0A7R9ELJ6_9NEOP|nr:unnamed protein product [Timema bartmani]
MRRGMFGVGKLSGCGEECSEWASCQDEERDVRSGQVVRMRRGMFGVEGCLEWASCQDEERDVWSGQVVRMRRGMFGVGKLSGCGEGCLEWGVLSTEMELNSGSRTEFISADILENPIEYGRTGGWFFSFTKVVVFVLVALTAAVLTGVIVYFSFPCSRVEVDRVVLYMPNSRIEGSSSEPGSDRLNGTTPTGSPDTLDSTTSVPVTDLRLPNTLIPLHYKLRVQPFIEESHGDNFTFQVK